ncbi:MAG: hypothetical protein ABIG11_10965 [bacterium]
MENSPTEAVRPSYQGLEPGGREEQTLHFLVQTYSSEKARAYGALAENNYERIMHDTGIYSFVPRDPYSIVVYGTREEFHAKTGQPEWSGGITVGNAMLIFDSPEAGAIMAHEMTHVIFNEYMVRFNEDNRWINEGLAVYEEIKASLPSRRDAYFKEASRLVKDNPLPFSQMVHLVPAQERERLVNAWYLQAASVVRFMLEHGSRLGFSVFLARLKDGRSADQALDSAYPGLWKDINALEKAWLSATGG